MDRSVESALRHIKPRVRELKAYTLRPYAPEVKLNQNENPFDVPAELKERLLAVLSDRPWNRYPPFVAREFTSAVAETTGWPEEGVLVGNGSNELIQAILATVVEPGVAVVIPEPTFTLYGLLTGVGGGRIVSVPLDANLRFDVDAIVAAARREDPALIVVCTPNNPTGAALAAEEIEELHDQTDALIVLDQAYVEFGGFDALPLLPDRPRLVILRTFSKAMALAGLRAGYLLAHPRLATEFAKAKLPYNLNFFTEQTAAEVLRKRDLLEPHIDEIRRQRDRIMESLAGLPCITVFQSEANFVLFRVESDQPDNARVFSRLLDEFGVLVRDVSSYPMLDGCLRVNAGTPAETKRFLDAMKRIMEGVECPAAD